MSADTDLATAVANLSSVVAAAVADIQALTAQIGNASNDPAVVAAVGQLNTLASNLAAALPPAPAAG